MPISPDTQLLTLGSGWKFIKDITVDDMIASASKVNDAGIPVFTYERPYDVEIVKDVKLSCHFQNKHLNVFVSADHPMWIGEVGDKHMEFRFESAMDVIGKAVHYCKVGQYDDVEDSRFSVVSESDCKKIVESFVSACDTCGCADNSCKIGLVDKTLAQLALHGGCSLDIFVNTGMKNRNEKEIVYEKDKPFVEFLIHDDNAFYSIMDFGYEMYNVHMADAQIVFARRHGRACWIGC